MGVVLAIMDVDGVLGREVSQILETGMFEWVSELRLFGDQQTPAASFRGEQVTVVGPTDDRLKGVDIAIGGGAREIKLGAVCISLAHEGGDGPIVIRDINPDAIDEHRGQILIPEAVGVTIATLAGGLGVPVSRVTGTALVPAGILGARAIETLYQQTLALFNQQSLDEGEIGARLAFNVLPGPMLHGLGANLEFPVHVTPLVVPVFGGTLMSLDFWTAQPVTFQEVYASLSQCPSVEICEEAHPADIVEQSNIRVVTPDVHDSLVRIVAVIDEVRRSAISLLQVAEEVASQEAF